MKDEKVIERAEFDERVCTYWLVSGVLVLGITIVGIPLLLLWFPLGLGLTRRYLARMACVLTERRLIVRKGWLIRMEKTAPLDKITDLGMVQGPLMRLFGLYQLTVETAGQSGQGALISLVGIKDAEQFRERVLEQRDRVTERESQADQGIASSQSAEAETLHVLKDIRQTLHELEQLAKRQATRSASDD